MNAGTIYFMIGGRQQSAVLDDATGKWSCGGFITAPAIEQLLNGHYNPDLYGDGPSRGPWGRRAVLEAAAALGGQAHFLPGRPDTGPDYVACTGPGHFREPSQKPPRKRRRRIGTRKTPDVLLPDVRQVKPWACGPANLRCVGSALAGWTGTEEEAIQLTGATEKDGTPPAGMVRGAAALGLAPMAGTMSLKDMARETAAGFPVVCAVQSGVDPNTESQGHYVTVCGVDEKEVRYQDPVGGPKSRTVKEWMDRWHDRDTAGTEYARWGMACRPPAWRPGDPARGAKCGGPGSGVPGPCPQDKPEEKPSPRQSSWKPGTTMEEVSAGAKALNVGKVSTPGFSGKQAVDRANEILSETNRLHEAHPRLARLVNPGNQDERDGRQLQSLQIHNVMQLPPSRENPTMGAAGRYTNAGRTMLLASAGRSAAPSSPELGSWAVDGSRTGSFRHEYGHHVYDLLTPDQKTEWGRAVTGASQSGDLKKTLSVYGASSHEEAFAESFNAFTHPGYGQGGKKLPGPLHDHLANLLGGR